MAWKFRKGKYRSFFKDMSDRELLKYTFSTHENITRGELNKKDMSLYNTLRHRGLLDKIRPNPNRRERGFLSRKTDVKLLIYIFSNYGINVLRSELSKKDMSLYLELRKRGLLDRIKLVNPNINPNRKEYRYWQDFDNFKEETWKVIEQNNRVFPTQTILKNKRSGLINAINKYYGGIYAVKEKIGYNEMKRQELAKELEEIINEMWEGRER